jgi:hypothetical protein
MADLSNTSFIPKQNPAKIKRRTATRQVYFLTLASYVLIIAALIASAAVFLYERYSKNTLAEEITGLNADVANFKQSDMDMVTELSERLQATEEVVESNVSIPAVLSVLELSTIASMQFKDTTIKRKDSTTIVLEASIITDSFDSVLFQREIYKRASTLAGVTLTDVAINLAPSAEGVAESNSGARVALKATFNVPANTVLYAPTTSVTPTFIVPNSTTTATATNPISTQITPPPSAPATTVPPSAPTTPGGSTAGTGL